MKKVCIVTLYGNYNLGNKLQNYAVQQQMLKYGIKVKTLKIIDIGETNNRLLTRLFNEIRRLKHWLFNDKLFINHKFKEFQQQYLLIDKRERYSNENNGSLSKKYDYFAIGSDQVWNPDFGIKGDLTFLEFASKNTIAFSASIGVDEIPNKLKEKYSKGLNKLEYISVREDKAKELVEGLTGRKDIEVLVDPTMLLDKKEWQKISKKPQNISNKKYILTYFLGKVTDDIKKEINNIAKENNFEIIDIMKNGNPQEWIGPSEFIYLEEHAQLICTDSFHSCVFGILMQTPFVIFERQDHNKSMSSRLNTLLAKFKLEGRRYNGRLDENVFICDYSHCDEILKEERKKSDKFLEKALGIKGNKND